MVLILRTCCYPMISSLLLFHWTPSCVFLVHYPINGDRCSKSKWLMLQLTNSNLLVDHIGLGENLNVRPRHFHERLLLEKIKGNEMIYSYVPDGHNSNSPWINIRWVSIVVSFPTCHWHLYVPVYFESASYIFRINIWLVSFLSWVCTILLERTFSQDRFP